MWPPKASAEPHSVRAYAFAILSVALATLLAFALFGRSELADIVMVYLLAIVVVATRAGFRASVVCGALSVLAFNFFFTQPYYTFGVSDLRHVVTFAVMLLVGVVVATLTQRVRDQVEVAHRSERRTQLLYAMSRELARTEGMTRLVRVGTHHLEEVFGARVALLAPGSADELRIDYATEGFTAPVESESNVVHWVLGHRRPAGIGTETLASSQGFYVPLVSSGAEADVMGVVGIYPRTTSTFDDPEQQLLADAFATQLATAIERARLAEETERARIQIEAEQLRNTLLSSVSHDLRTPLAVMRGAASTLVDDDGELEASVRRELASALFEETERMDRQIKNLLDMTRLESGAVRIQREWQSLQEVVGAAWSRVEPRLGGREVTIRVPADLDASFDAVLIEQVIVNLLAAKYTPEGSPIEVTAEADEADVTVVVSDRGPGIPVEEQERIFDKFYRGSSERTRTGVGLGLTICRAIVAAHGGTIRVRTRPDGGASFAFTLPRQLGPVAGGELPEILETS